MDGTYSKFATVYDALMEDIPYDDYVDILSLAAHTLQGKDILDVGCGTGTLSRKLAMRGSHVTAIDLSSDMLDIAREQAIKESVQIEFLEQSMDCLQLNKQFDLAVIAIDSLNYIVEKEAVMATFHNIYKALKQGGTLIFDVHSTFKTDVIFFESPFTYDDGDIAYLWNTEEGEFEHSVQSHIAFFVKQPNGLYERFDERHYQRTFSIQSYIEMLTTVGFTLERVFADWEDEAPEEESERIFFQVRK